MASGLERKRGRAYTTIWGSVFIIVMICLIGAMYFASREVDYVWRWYRIPQYFFYEHVEEIRSSVQGTVASVTPDRDGYVIDISGEEPDRIVVEHGTPSVSPGDFVFPGDIVGRFKEWRIGILIQGLWMTLKISMLAILAGVTLGLFTGLARISVNPALRWSAMTYIELIRGSPLLVQIFIWYFVFGTVINNLLSKYGIQQISPFWFGVAALAFFTGAYVAEIVRAGIQSIHRGQMEAARSLGMNYAQAMRHCILPQALRRILPPLAGQFISLIKDSSLLGIIAIRELTKATREVVTTSLQPFELWFICAVLYLVLTFSFSLFVQYLERRVVEK